MSMWSSGSRYFLTGRDAGSVRGLGECAGGWNAVIQRFRSADEYGATAPPGAPPDGVEGEVAVSSRLGHAGDDQVGDREGGKARGGVGEVVVAGDDDAEDG